MNEIKMFPKFSPGVSWAEHLQISEAMCPNRKYLAQQFLKQKSYGQEDPNEKCLRTTNQVFFIVVFFWWCSLPDSQRSPEGGSRVDRRQCLTSRSLKG